MYSVIIPTMWKCDRLTATLQELNDHPLVGEIILIDNTPNTLKIKLSKVNHILEGKNTYVNPAWNKGVELSKYDKLLILNDDIWMDWRILDILEPYITEQNGLIGLHDDYNVEYPESELCGLQATMTRTHGFGCAIFVHKENYSPIPEQMKLWSGDDWLFVKARNRRKQNYILVDYTINGEISATTNSLDDDSNIEQIKEVDLMLKHYYRLF